MKPKKLVRMEIDKVAGVDRAANGRKFLIIKRDGEVEKAYGADGSYERLGEGITAAYKERFGNGYVRATFSDHAIIEDWPVNGPSACYSVEWSEVDGEIVLGERTEVEAETNFVPVGKAVTKTEGGTEGFTSADYAYTPSTDKPSTWKLRLTKEPGGDPDPAIVGAAIAALGKGFRGNTVDIPEADLPAVKAKVKAAWKKANPNKTADDVPSILKGGAAVDIEKAGAKYSAQTKTMMQGVMEGMKALMGKVKTIMADAGMEEPQVGSQDVQKGGAMSLTDEQREELDEEVRKHVEELEAKVEELEAKPEPVEDITKGMTDEVKKAFEDMQEKIAKAEATAETEREARLEREYADKAAQMPYVGSGEEIAKMLRTAYEVSEEHGQLVEKNLRAASEKIEKGDLFKEIGRGGEVDDEAGHGKLEKLAKAKAETDGISQSAAMAAVLETPEGKKLYAEGTVK